MKEFLKKKVESTVWHGSTVQTNICIVTVEFTFQIAAGAISTETQVTHTSLSTLDSH